MADIFDTVTEQQGGDIFDRVSPAPTPPPKPQTFMDMVGNALKYGVKSMVGIPDSSYIMGPQTGAPQPSFLNSAKEALLAVPEAAGSLVSGLGGSVVGKVAGEVQSAISGLRGEPNWGDKARQTREAVQKAVTYQPTTESGKALANVVGGGLSLPFKAVSYPFTKAGEYATEKGYPNLGYTLEDTGDTLAYALGPKVAGKVGEIGSKAPEVAKQAFNKAVDYGLDKGIKQLVSGRGTYPLSQKKIGTGRDMVQSIIENKDNLELTDPATGEAMPKGSLPSGKNSIIQMAQAADQTKKMIWKQVDEMQKATTGQGVEADMSPTVKMLNDKLKDKTLALRPDLRKYIEGQRDAFQGLGKLSIEDNGGEIAARNEDLKSFYKNPQYGEKSKTLVDADIVDSLRKAQDDAITGVEGPGFQALKNKYGSILDHEKEINQRAVVAARSNPKGFFDLGNIAIYGELARAIIKPDLGSAAFAGGGWLAKKMIQAKNNPNNIVSNMFKEADKNLGYYGTELNEPLPPLGGKGDPNVTANEGVSMPNTPLSMDWLYKGKTPTPLQGIEMPQQGSGLMLEKDFPPPPLMGPVGPGTTPASVTPLKESAMARAARIAKERNRYSIKQEAE